NNPVGVEVVRLEPRFTLGQIVIASGIKRELDRIKPDLVVVIGLGKAFPKPVFDTNHKVIVLLGDNAHSYVNGSFQPKLLFHIVKGPSHRRSIRGSAPLVVCTPESFAAAAVITGRMDAEILRQQIRFISLGFSPDDFSFTPILRDVERAELGYTDSDSVIIPV